MLLMVDDHGARQELDLVVEESKCLCSWQESRVHKDALAERNIIGDLPGLIKNESGFWLGYWIFAIEPYQDVGNGQKWLINNNLRDGRTAAPEADLPRTFAIAAMLDESIRNNVNGHGDDESHDEVADGAIGRVFG
jgi:hypothetical protein